MYIDMLYLQKTGNAGAQLTQEEIQSGINKANEQTMEALECELFLSSEYYFCLFHNKENALNQNSTKGSILLTGMVVNVFDTCTGTIVLFLRGGGSNRCLVIDYLHIFSEVQLCVCLP